MYMSSLAVVAMYFKQNIGIATGLSLLGTGCGIIVTPVVIQWLVNLFSWRGAMIVWAAVFVQCTPLCTLYTPLYQISSSSYNGPIHLNHLYTSHFVCFLLSSFFFSAGAGIVWILLGDYVKQVGLTENNGSQLITCIGGGEVIGTVGWCALTQTRFSIKQASKMRIYNAGVGLRCLTIAMYPLFTNFSALVTISIVHGVGYGVQNAVFVASLIEFIRNNDVAFALGFYGITYGMGGLLGPPVGGKYVMHCHCPLDTRRCCDVKSTSLTLIQRHNNTVCPVGGVYNDIIIFSTFKIFPIIILCHLLYFCRTAF